VNKDPAAVTAIDRFVDEEHPAGTAGVHFVDKAGMAIHSVVHGVIEALPAGNVLVATGVERQGAVRAGCFAAGKAALLRAVYKSSKTVETLGITNH
jgi:hypothetical protein